jgi:hypothetical protein
LNVGELRPAYVQAHRDDLGEVLASQAEIVTSVWEQTDTPAVVAVFDRQRWNRLLADRVFVRNKLTASDFGRSLADELGTEFDPSTLDDLLLVNADIAAEGINAVTEESLQRAMTDPDDPDAALRGALAILTGSRLDEYAETTVTTSSNFGLVSAAEQGGMRTKTWRVNSRNPRSAHASLNGRTIPIGEAFSTGQMWPGDPAGGADHNANCQCSVDFGED